MKISASIQAATQLSLLKDIQDNSDKFDYIHVDITDGHFTNNISMSFKVIKELKEHTNYFVDVHLMLNENSKYVQLAFDSGADLVVVHQESTNLDEFISLSKKYENIGIGLLPNTPNTELKEYVAFADSVLLLGVTPGFSNQKPVINLKEKVEDFKILYPDFTGLLIVDGGVVNKDIDDYKELSVDIVVQGGAIFAEHP